MESSPTISAAAAAAFMLFATFADAGMEAEANIRDATRNIQPVLIFFFSVYKFCFTEIVFVSNIILKSCLFVTNKAGFEDLIYP
jgi:hypothetical protein